MKYDLNKTSSKNRRAPRRDVQTLKYLDDYFAAKLADSGSYDPTKLKVYDHNPLERGNDAKPITGKELRNHLAGFHPVFAVYEDGKSNRDVIPFMEHNNAIVSGTDLYQILMERKPLKEQNNLQNPTEPTKPVEPPKPSGFAKFLSFFGIKVQSVKIYEAYQKDLANYKRFFDMKFVERESKEMDESELEEDINKLREARGDEAAFEIANGPKIGEAAIDHAKIKTTIVDDKLQIGNAAVADPVGAKEEPNKEPHGHHKMEHMDPVQFELDAQETKRLRKDATQKYNQDEQEFHTITAAEFDEIPDEDKQFWSRLPDGRYEDTIWRGLKNEEERSRSMMRAKYSVKLDGGKEVPVGYINVNRVTKSTEAQRALHNTILNKLWDTRETQRAADCKLILDTIVNQLWEETPYPMGLRRSEIARQIRESDEMHDMLNEFTGATEHYAKMARENPQELYQAFGKRVAESLDQEELEENQPAEENQIDLESAPVKDNGSGPVL